MDTFYTKSGCDGVLKLGEVGGPLHIVSEVTSWSISLSANSKEFLAIGRHYPVRGVTSYEWSLTVDGYFEMFDDGQKAIEVGKCKSFELYPIGEGADMPKLSGEIFIDSSDSSGSPDDLIPYSASATGNSTLVSEEFWLGDEVTYNATPIADVTGLLIAGDNLTISWTAVTGATGYLLRYQDGASTDWESATPFLTVPLKNTTYISPFDLVGKTVLVKAVDDCSESPNAATLSPVVCSFEFEDGTAVGLVPPFDVIAPKSVTELQNSNDATPIAIIGGIGSINFANNKVGEFAVAGWSAVAGVVRITLFDLASFNQIIIQFTAAGGISISSSTPDNASTPTPAFSNGDLIGLNVSGANIIAMAFVAGVKYTATIPIPAAMIGSTQVGPQLNVNSLSTPTPEDFVVTWHRDAGEIVMPGLEPGSVDWCDNSISP